MMPHPDQKRAIGIWKEPMHKTLRALVLVGILSTVLSPAASASPQHRG